MWLFKLHRDKAALERLRQSRDWWKTRALAAERQRDAAWDLTSQQNRVIQEQGAELAGLREQLAEATGPNPLTADNDRLARELNLSQQSAVSIAQTARAQVDAAKAETARLQRRWDGHAAVCPVARQLEDVDRDKAVESQ